MCKLGPYPTVETYFNYDHYPGILNATNRSVGITQQAVAFDNDYFVCSARRVISISNISDQFYDLNNPYFLLMAKGQLKRKISLKYFL